MANGSSGSREAKNVGEREDRSITPGLDSYRGKGSAGKER